VNINLQKFTGYNEFRKDFDDSKSLICSWYQSYHTNSPAYLLWY